MKKISLRQRFAERVIRWALKIYDVQYMSARDWEIELKARDAESWCRKHILYGLERWEKFDQGTRFFDVPIDFDTIYPNLDELSDADREYYLQHGKLPTEK